MSKISGTLVALALLMTSTVLQATSISLNPAATSVVSGDQIVVDLHMNFSDDPTLGGALNLSYDQDRLSFISFDFNPLFTTDPFFTSTGDASVPGIISAISFGDFISGIAGPALVGSFVFEASSTGDAVLSLAENVLPLGGFYSFATSQEQNPDLLGTSLTVTAVPLPAAFWLFMSGALGMFGVMRRAK